MAKYVFKEFDKDKNAYIKFHYLEIPQVRDPNFYKDIRSLSAFVNPFYPKRRKINNRIFFAIMEDQFESNKALFKNNEFLKEIYNGIPEQHYSKLDDFYQSIGYDRKNKKLV